MISPRQYTVLRILSKANKPVQACVLHKLGNEDVLYQKLDGDFWREDTSTLLGGMALKGLITKVQLPNNTVFYAITVSGQQELLAKEEPSQLLKMRELAVSRLVRRACYRGEEYRDKLIEEARKLPPDNLSHLLAHAFGVMVGHYRFELSKYPDSNYQREELEKVMVIFESLVKELSVELQATTTVEMTRVADAKIKREHEEELERNLAQGVVEVKSLGKCHFCGAEIHNKEAEDDRKLLEKFTQVKTAMVCCSCYGHLRWLEEHMVGGEKCAGTAIAST